MFVSCLPQRHHVTTINWQKKHVQATSRVYKQEPLKHVKNEVAHIAVSVRRLQQGTTKRTCPPTKLWDKHSVVPNRSTNARSLHPLRGSICVTSAGCEARQSVRVGKQSAHTCAQTPCLRNKKHRKVEHIELGFVSSPSPIDLL